MLTRLLLTCSIATTVGVLSVPAAAERVVIPYQGILKKSGQIYTGSAEMKFAIVNQGTILWSNDEIDKRTQEPRRSVTVQVTDGQFCVSLGDEPMKPLESQVLTRHPSAALRVWVSTGGPFDQLSDQPLDAEDATREGSPGNHWSLRGNRDIDPDQDFLGTTDGQPLVVRANSIRVLTLPCLGAVEVHRAIAVHGDETVDSSLTVKGTTKTSGLTVDGEFSVNCLTILGGCDLSEPFKIGLTAAVGLEPGLVVSIDAAHPGELVLASVPYDTKVAGVISGANGIHTGMIMARGGSPTLDGPNNVALAGRVYVYASDCNGSIAPGDLLTTSSTAGYAMKATDARRARGAVIGKAMSSLKDSKGFVLLLVQPQ